MEHTAVGKSSDPHIKFYLVLIKEKKNLKNSDSVPRREAGFGNIAWLPPNGCSN